MTASPAKSLLRNSDCSARRNALQHLPEAARPADLHVRLLRQPTEMNRGETGRRVAHRTRHRIGLIADPDLSAQSVAVRLLAHQMDVEPSPPGRTEVSPQLRWRAQRGDDNIHSTVPVEIRKATAPVRRFR